MRREVLRGDQRRGLLGKLREVRRAAELGERRVIGEHRPQRHRRCEHGAVHELQNRGVNLTVHRLEEMFGAQLQLHVLGEPVVDHHRAEQRRLRI